ncbi:hypothetical protein LRS14_06360 [Aquincola sp. J276]|nr:hypothetical protein [Aquincola sp. J276]MCR5864877.1 hypothetical protein [Aquincola sp. J276]
MRAGIAGITADHDAAVGLHGDAGTDGPAIGGMEGGENTATGAKAAVQRAVGQQPHGGEAVGGAADGITSEHDLAVGLPRHAGELAETFIQRHDGHAAGAEAGVQRAVGVVAHHGAVQVAVGTHHQQLAVRLQQVGAGEVIIRAQAGDDPTASAELRGLVVGHHHVERGRIGGGAESGAAAVHRGVQLAAGAAGRLVPGAEAEGGAPGAAVAGHQPDQVLLAQRKRRTAGHGADIRPRRAAVQRVLPAAGGARRGRDDDAGCAGGVGIAHLARQEGGHRLAGVVPVQRGQRREFRGRRREHRRRVGQRLPEHGLALQADGQRGLDHALMHLQPPVTTQQRGAGEVVGSGHVGAGELRQRLHECQAVAAGGHVAAVQQHIGIGGQCGAPGAELIGPLRQRGGVQHLSAQADGTTAAVADQVQRRQPAVRAQHVADLRQRVDAGLQQQGLDGPARVGLGLDVGQQDGGAFHLGIDEDQFGHLRVCSRGSRRRRSRRGGSRAGAQLFTRFTQVGQQLPTAAGRLLRQHFGDALGAVLVGCNGHLVGLRLQPFGAAAPGRQAGIVGRHPLVDEQQRGRGLRRGGVQHVARRHQPLVDHGGRAGQGREVGRIQDAELEFLEQGLAEPRAEGHDGGRKSCGQRQPRTPGPATPPYRRGP